MADSEDLKRLMSGEVDLSRCDFREAQLSGLDLRGRDFSHSLFQKAQCDGTRFDDSDFRDAKVSFMSAKNANFDRCNLEKLHFGYADLSNASLRSGKANGALFQSTKLDGANVEGATFRGGQIDVDTTLKGVISSSDTDFDDLRLLRSTSRDPLFDGYSFNQGTLHRIAAIEPTTEFDSTDFKYVPEGAGSQGRKKIVTAEAQIQHLLRNAILTHFTARQFADQIEHALRDVPATNENKLVEPLQTMLEFVDVLRRFAPETQPPEHAVDRVELELHIAELEERVVCLTRQLSDEAKARESAEALAKSDGFKAHFRRAAGKAAGTAVVGAASILVATGVPTAAVYFLGADNTVVTTLLSVVQRPAK